MRLKLLVVLAHPQDESMGMDDMAFTVDEQIRGEVGWKDWMITARIEIAKHCCAAWGAIQCC